VLNAGSIASSPSPTKLLKATPCGTTLQSRWYPPSGPQPLFATEQPVSRDFSAMSCTNQMVGALPRTIPTSPSVSPGSEPPQSTPGSAIGRQSSSYLPDLIVSVQTPALYGSSRPRLCSLSTVSSVRYTPSGKSETGAGTSVGWPVDAVACAAAPELTGVEAPWLDEDPAVDSPPAQPETSRHANARMPMAAREGKGSVTVCLPVFSTATLGATPRARHRANPVVAILLAVRGNRQYAATMARMTPYGALSRGERALVPWPAMCAVSCLTAVASIACLISTGLMPSSPVGLTGLPVALTAPALGLLLLLVTAGWSVVEAAPRSAVGLSVAGVAWLAAALAAWPLLTAETRALLLASMPLSFLGFALLVAGWRGKTPHWAWLCATGVLSVLAAAAHAFGYDPFLDPGCSRTCESSPAHLVDAVGARAALGISLVLTAAAAVACVTTIVLSRTASPVICLAGLMAATLTLGAAVLPWWRWGDVTAPALADAFESVGIAVITLATLSEALRAQGIRRDLRTLVERVGDRRNGPNRSGSVKAVHFAVPPDGRWVDGDGKRIAGEPANAAFMADDAGPSVRLSLRRWASSEQVVSSITPAGRLVLENARLRAASASLLASVQASQRRIVEATDGERRRIERDLHDGAQQRLVAVGMHLAVATPRSDDSTRQSLEDARIEVRRALAALRELSHDSLNSVLATEGMAAAVEDVVAASHLRVEKHVALSGHPIAAPIESAGLFALGAALDNVARHADTDLARVTVDDIDHTMFLQVADDGLGGAGFGPSLTDVADRVSALGGAFELVSRPGDGTTMTVRIPCAS